MTALTVAFDKSSRHFDTDGRLHVSKSNISKEIVNPYYGIEIPGYAELGLDPNKVYYLYRPGEELAKAAPTFNNLPILYAHHKYVSAENPEKDSICGSIGSDVEFNAPYLNASLCFWDAKAIAAIESEEIEDLSCSYHYTAVMQPGEFEGVAYDGYMTDIKGNHLALVENGRAGPDVVVADSNPFVKPEVKSMKKTKLGAALSAVLMAASTTLAADSALPSLVNSLTKKTLNRDALKKALIAKDSALTPEHLDKIIDAAIGVSDIDEKAKSSPDPIEAGAGDEEDENSPQAKLRKWLMDKGHNEDEIKEAMDCMSGGDADPEKSDNVDENSDIQMSEASKMKEKPAMDAATLTRNITAKIRGEFKELEQAKEDVRSVVGGVIGMDSAGQVYQFALKEMGIAFDGISDQKALRAIFKAAQSSASANTTKQNSVAYDAKTLSDNVVRFRIAG
jgi:hypothetical protein